MVLLPSRRLSRSLPYPGKATKARWAVTRTANGGTKSCMAAPRTLHRPTAKPQWAQQVSAWLAPLFVASIDAAGGDHGPESTYQRAEQYLRDWRQHIRFAEPNGATLTISQEIALAQGFKYAANRRYGQVRSPAGRGRAVYRQRPSRCSSMLATGSLSSPCSRPSASGRSRRASGRPTARHANPDAIVNHWLEEIHGEQASGGRADHRIHPFVEAAAVLAARALETGHPERFLWMDESDLVTRVGSSQEVTDSQARRHDQWIQPSMGWSGLDRHAQQLVADVLLLLNLAERGEQPGKIEQWLRTRKQGHTTAMHPARPAGATSPTTPSEPRRATHPAAVA